MVIIKMYDRALRSINFIYVELLLVNPFYLFSFEMINLILKNNDFLKYHHDYLLPPLTPEFKHCHIKL